MGWDELAPSQGVGVASRASRDCKPRLAFDRTSQYIPTRVTSACWACDRKYSTSRRSYIPFVVSRDTAPCDLQGRAIPASPLPNQSRRDLYGAESAGGVGGSASACEVSPDTRSAARHTASKSSRGSNGFSMLVEYRAARCGHARLRMLSFIKRGAPSRDNEWRKNS